MTGASDLHNELSGKLYTRLRQHLRGTECRVLMADVKLRVEAADCGFYPDLLMTCAGSNRADRHVKNKNGSREPVSSPSILPTFRQDPTSTRSARTGFFGSPNG